MKVSCSECACADRKHMKCRPNDRDCEAEYNLEEKDFTTKSNCDFFQRKIVLTEPDERKFRSEFGDKYYGRKDYVELVNKV